MILVHVVLVLDPKHGRSAAKVVQVGLLQLHGSGTQQGRRWVMDPPGGRANPGVPTRVRRMSRFHVVQLV